jgi:putative tryptophan/tyrosine transport system substrate-binding protein
MAAIRLLVLLALLAAPLAAGAQPAGRVYRLGLLPEAFPLPTDERTSTFGIPTALRELGYVEGQNLVIERRFAEGKLERLPALAPELVQLGVDVVVPVGGAAIRAAKAATTTIPIVMFGGSDPVAAGFVTSLARPGGDITGILILPGDSIAGKKLELLKEAVPQAARIALLAPADDPRFRPAAQEAQKAASALGIKLVVVEVRGGTTLAPSPRSRPSGLRRSSSARPRVSRATGSESSSWPRATGCPRCTSGPRRWKTAA